MGESSQKAALSAYEVKRSLKTEGERYVEFLQWALPRLGLCWTGFRKVRRQVIKRIVRRIKDLQLGEVGDYRRYLKDHPQEWQALDAFCRITISRFYRDRRVFDVLAWDGLKELLNLCRSRGESRLLAWSAGCGGGEEAYTLALIWKLDLAPLFPDTSFSLIATDADPNQIARAQRACYHPSCLKELPQHLRERGFFEAEGRYCIRPDYRPCVTWVVQDLRRAAPDDVFHLVLCRNLAFTYFVPAEQKAALQRIEDRLIPGGLLVLGAHERLPHVSTRWEHWRPGLPIYRKVE